MTGSEGIALAGIILSALLGYLAYRTSREARTDAHNYATEMRQATAVEARAARLFEVRRTVYVDIMDYVYLLEDFVMRTEPIMSGPNDPPPPRFPPEEEQRHKSAEIAAFGSPAMRDKLLVLRRAGLDFQGSVWVLQGDRKAHGLHSDEAIKAWKAVEEKRQAVHALVKEIEELMNEELRT